MTSKRYTQYMYSYPHKTAYRPLEGYSLKDTAPCLAGPGHSLYLHIPFCQTKCGYCNLFSVTGQNAEQMDAYLDAVERQAAQYQELFSPLGTEFSDFTIGGGTPLLLTMPQLRRMFSMVHSHLALADAAQIVIETAPNQTTDEKLLFLKEEGVTRVSMGIQSFSDKELSVLRRNHCSQKARESLSLLKKYEFPCINIDFIYGVPGQTVDSLLGSLREALLYEPDELFLYPLYVKPGVLLAQDIINGMVSDQNLAYEQYCEASGFLAGSGYTQMSMRRFVRSSSLCETPSFQDCGFGTSLALGCGGRSYLGRLHTCTPYSVGHNSCLFQLEAYENTVDFTSIHHGYLLSDDEIRRRYVIRHLLICPGLHKDAYYSHFHSQAMADYPVLADWAVQGYIKDVNGFLSLTEEGLGLSDWLGPQLISPEVRTKMNGWEEPYGKADASLSGKP